MNAFARARAQALSGAAPAAAAGAVDGAADKSDAESGPRRAGRRRCRGRAGAGLIDDTAIASSLEQANAMWHLRERSPSPRPRNRTSSTTFHCRLGDPRLRRLDRRGPAAPCPASTGQLRPPRRRQPALQRAVLEGDDASSSSGTRPRSTDRLRRGRQRNVDLRRARIGRLKLGEMSTRKSPVALAMMRAIKAALDPAGVLNPGRVLPPPATP